MAKPIEFSKFYKLLDGAKKGDKEKIKELEWVLAEYEHANDSDGAFDELGQIFCHIGLMELYLYTGIDDIKYLSGLEESIWKYLKKRNGLSVEDHMVIKMKEHAKEHDLIKKASNKWAIPLEEVENNLEELAKYVTEGIVEIII